ncbi:TonB-dependent receptor [Altericroceibacterium indicum]|uniref:TonB-dependent receptor n=1 Tax=Altericroceibacterium indicum TaxID=374177 RepID=UPI001FEC014F|nr:TonB-dependent receptor [Altericroceibacterium indicum]
MAAGFILPHYVTAKAAVEYALSCRVALRLEADNIFDERYADRSSSQLWIFPDTLRSVKGQFA